MTDRLFKPQDTRREDSRVPSNVWLVQQERARDQRATGAYVDDVYHAQKMVPELARRMIEHAKLPAGATVLDPMCGIGTTGVEAFQMGYRFVGNDLYQPYIDGAVTNLRAIGALDGDMVTLKAGDARDLSWLADRSIDLIVTSPSYGDSDPLRDSSGWSLAERAARGEGYAAFAAKTGAYGNATSAPMKVKGSMGSMSLVEWEASMTLALREMRRVLKPNAFCLMAVREFWQRRGKCDMVDLPGRTLAIAQLAGLAAHDMIYAVDTAIDAFGRMRSRAGLHHNRLAKQMKGRPCPRGTPGVTRVLVLQRRSKQKAAKA